MRGVTRREVAVGVVCSLAVIVGWLVNNLHQQDRAVAKFERQLCGQSPCPKPGP